MVEYPVVKEMFKNNYLVEVFLSKGHYLHASKIWKVKLKTWKTT